MDTHGEDVTTEEIRRRMDVIVDDLRQEVLKTGYRCNVNRQVPLRLPAPSFSPRRNDSNLKGAVLMAALLGLCNVRLFGIWGLILLSAYLSELTFLITREEPHNAHAFEAFHVKARGFIVHAITLSSMPFVRRGIFWTISVIAAFPQLSATTSQSPEVIVGLLSILLICFSIVWAARRGFLRMSRLASIWKPLYPPYGGTTAIIVTLLETLRGVQKAAAWRRRLYARLAGVFAALHLPRYLLPGLPHSPPQSWGYRPLTQPRQIRLVRLHRWVPFRGVRATITHVELENPPLYDAISYHWGTSEERRRLKVLDEIGASSSPRWLEVSEPTYDALYNLSSPWKTRLLWIDAVCIDQSPHPRNTEKGAQVMLMREIYGKANRVIVYLGNSVLAPAAHSLIHELILLRSAGCHGSELYQKVSRGEGMSVRWIALIELLAQPWFRRVWVIQEVAAASLNSPRIWYGGRLYDWTSLLAAFELLGGFEMANFLQTVHQGRVAVDHLQSMRSMDDMRKRVALVDMNRWSKGGLMQSPAPLFYLLESSMAHQASDARDKVFALLGLTGDDHPPKLTPDYRSETTVESVYVNTAKYLLTTKRPLSFLQLAGVGVSRRHQALPSWVPDWAGSTDRGAPMSPTLWEQSKFRCNYYRATGSARPAFSTRRVGDREALALSCTRVDTLAQLSAVHAPAIEDDEFISIGPVTLVDPRDMLEAHRWHQETLAMVLGSHAPDPYPSGRNASWQALPPPGPADSKGVESDKPPGPGRIPSQPLREVFWRVLTGDLNLSRMLRPAPMTRQEDYNNWVFFMAEMAAYLAIDSKDARVPVHDVGFWRRYDAGLPFANAMASCAVGRRVCVTAAGRLGCVPPLSQVEDEVVLIHGAPTPFVIRKIAAEIGADSNLYELVGACYMHGMMDGEALPADDTQEAEKLVLV
ncbi:hypothetical protein MAPG_03428 [Magnaporthiopsis poae ATCC 64411]|uniref:Heterokaryon incompatibility domain-containing protein n=1 Tax=Magnaporthiopsis poae (strain ATCC 64411 / 73-15) TaxID=644358 RepID=A0A0C4DTZ7_MAGP6|nr:hypothetical protein MAPG_03428 [Magnaporthiopsis poae ATCC 64411]